MKKIAAGLLIAFVLWSCSHKSSGPDVSGIKVDVKLERFEKSFFAIDTNNIGQGLTKTHGEFPDFYPDFMQNILGVSGNPADTTTVSVTRNILRSYASFAAELENKFRNTGSLEKELKRDFQFVKHYFPDYKIPVLVTYIGPLDAPGVALTRNRIAIGLQQYAGKDFQGYQANEVQQMYPAYISRRFDAAYIPANCTKAIADDLFPDKSTGRPLIEQMIEKGKQWWLLDKLMPTTADSLKTGYTEKQLRWCREN